MSDRTKLNKGLLAFLAVAFMAVSSPQAFALITGGEGNAPLNDPGWPKGAITLFNVASRIAWWEGPPFGGGQWHAECRGDARALSEVLAGFNRLDIKSKRVVLHDGVGNSFWLNMNNEPGKRAAAKMDWCFMVWQPDHWARLRQLPADLNPRFRTEQIPVGKVTIWVHKPGYCRPGLGQPITTPNEDVHVTMSHAGRIVVTVDFKGKQRPQGYMVHMEPEGGNAVGTYGGSGNINAQNQISFDNVPPARYVLRGQPNPGSSNERTDPVTVDLKGGQTAEIKLGAK